MSQRDIAIVGMECVFPGARNRDAYWENLVDGVDAISQIPSGRLNGSDRFPQWWAEHVPCNRGGFLPDDLRFEPLKFGVMPNIVPHGDPDQFLMLHVIDAALRDAGVADDDAVRQRADIIIGRGGYITNKMSEIYFRSDLANHLLDFLGRRFPQLADPQQREQLARELRAALPESDVDNLSTCIPNLVASRAANRLNLRGAAYTVDAACASSLVAVEHSIHRLRMGLCDLAVASGVFLCQTPTFWSIFTQLGAMSPSQQIRPFDRRADGLLVGEGAGAVVLKRLDDALRDGNEVYAIIKGAGSASDGRDTHILASSTHGQLEALKRAYQDAAVDPSGISYLEAHGTGTETGDLAEMQTIKAFFNRRAPFLPTRAFGSVKSMIGHTMPAAGIASLIKTALSLSNKCLLPSLHCEEPHEELRDLDFYINRETRPWIHPEDQPRRAGINAFGFGGINVHVVLEEVPDRAREPSSRIKRRPHNAGRRPSEVAAFSGRSAADLAARLNRVEAFLSRQRQPVALKDVAWTSVSEVQYDLPHKLAIVCRDVAELRERLRQCADALEQESPKLSGEGIYYSASAAQPLGKIGGIFPGMGFPGLIGTYPSHLLELCRHFPEVRAEFDHVELRDRHSEDPVPTSLIFMPPSCLPDDLQARLKGRIAAMKALDEASNIELPPHERNVAAVCVTLANWVSWGLLQNLKIPLAMACGQSNGEMAALCATGVLDYEELLPRFWQALSMSSAYVGQGRLAFIAMNEEKLAPHIADLPDTSVAIHVAPEMLIVGGTNEELKGLCKRLRSQGFIANELPFPPIHTPRLGNMREELKEVVNMDLRFRPPAFPIYSAVTADLFPPDEDGARELALDNINRPVKFWQTIHRMYADGARIFMQIGGGSLSSNIQTILPKPDVLGVAIDIDNRHPLTQLQHVCGSLFAVGVSLDFSYLFRYAGAKKLDFDAPAVEHRDTLALPLRLDFFPFPTIGTEPVAVQEDAEQPSVSAVVQTIHIAPNGVGETVTSAVSANAEENVIYDEPSNEESVEQLTDDVHVPEHEQAGQSDVAAELPLLPFIGSVLHLVPQQEIVVERVLDLDEDLFLHDHVLIGESSGKPVENRVPILPMTFILEVMAETAVCLGDGLGVIGFEKITAFRWIDFRDARTLRLEMKARLAEVDEATGVRRIAVEVFADGRSSATGTVLLHHSYREDVQVSIRELTNLRPWQWQAEEIYSERHMFHGPRFRCVSGLDRLGDEGMVGEITVPPKDCLFASQPMPQLILDPIVLDGVAQLVAMWAIANGFFLMPAKISRLELYGPTPPPGTRVPVRIDVSNLSAGGRTVTADAEVEDGQGGVWLRFQGINEWLYDYSPQLQDTQRLPECFHLASEIALPSDGDGTTAMILTRPDLRHANMEWLARLYLHQTEWLYFDALPTLARKTEWLTGRMAAKDAARLYLARQMGTLMLHPARLLIVVDEQGKPYLHPMDNFPDLPEISIAHSEQTAVALAAPAACGIDVEPISRDVSSLLSTFATAEESALIEAMDAAEPEVHWPTRLWCAKEAAAKAIGTGLDGRPRQFEAIDADSSGLLLIRHRATACTYTAATFEVSSFLVATASDAASGPQSSDEQAIEVGQPLSTDENLS
jgi:acyl transferase domain-containing protein/phosphopantetheinyl transferase